MTKNPKISVVIPLYKTDHKYLRGAIESILSQTYRDFEFLILNDSPEDTS
jgi:glycosyltransferase involved in cell wall biosynthesis